MFVSTRLCTVLYFTVPILSTACTISFASLFALSPVVFFYNLCPKVRISLSSSSVNKKKIQYITNILQKPMETHVLVCNRKMGGGRYYTYIHIYEWMYEYKHVRIVMYIILHKYEQQQQHNIHITIPNFRSFVVFCMPYVYVLYITFRIYINIYIFYIPFLYRYFLIYIFRSVG